MSVKLAFNNGVQIGFQQLCIKLAADNGWDANEVYSLLASKLAQIEEEGGPGLGTAAAATGAGLLGGGAVASELAGRGITNVDQARGTLNAVGEQLRNAGNTFKNRKEQLSLRLDNAHEAIQDARATKVDTLRNIKLENATKELDDAVARKFVGNTRSVRGLTAAAADTARFSRQVGQAGANLTHAEGSVSGRLGAIAQRLGIKDPKVLRRLAMGGGVGALGLGGLAAYNALS